MIITTTQVCLYYCATWLFLDNLIYVGKFTGTEDAF